MGGGGGGVLAISSRVIEALPHLHVLVVAGAGLAVEVDARGRVRKPLSLVVVSIDVEEDRVPRVLLVAAVPALFLRPIVLPLDACAILGDVRRI